MNRALVLSGGGSKGAFEVGVLDYLIHNRRVSFDLFAGSSVGALNAAYLAQGGDWISQSRRIEELKKQWLDIRGNRDIYHFNLQQIFHLFTGGSLYEPSGLKRLIENLIVPEKLRHGKPLLVPTVALEDGELYLADSRIEQDRDQITSFLLASASIPGYFPMVKIRGKHWVDGGLRENTPLNAVLNRNPREVFVITTYPLTPNLDPIFPSFNRTGNTLSIIRRVVDILTAEIGSNDLKLIQQMSSSTYNHYYRKYFRLSLITPEHPFTESSLNFSPELIREYFKLGYQAGRHPRIIFNTFS